MSRRASIVTGLGAVVLAGLGFVGAATASAYVARQARAERWRQLAVEHEGTKDQPSRTRVLFDGPELPIQEVEVTRSADQSPRSARVSLQDGTVLTLAFDGKRPVEVRGADGVRATLAYRGPRADVTFTGAVNGEATVVVPAALRAPLRVAVASPFALVGTAYAQDPPPPAPETVTVRRELPVSLEVKAFADDDEPAGEVLLEASCAPFTCVVADPERAMPGRLPVRITIAGTTPAPTDVGDASAYRAVASDERTAAQRYLDHAAAAVAAVGLVSKACRFAGVEASVCTTEKVEGAVVSLEEHEVSRRNDLLDDRADVLAREDAARASLDQPAEVELCANRPGYVRTCTTIDARPFAKAPLAEVSRDVALRRGLGGTLIGSFELRQRDGADCKFSPSPRLEGDLRLSFDPKAGTVTARFSGQQTGSRPNLRCSLGTANMRWNQSYNGTATQRFGADALRSGKPLDLSLEGRMTGTGSFSFSNCRTGGGASASCPAGKTDSYNYGLRITGRIDPTTQRGKGALIVTGSPLTTSGSWQVPKKEQAP